MRKLLKKIIFIVNIFLAILLGFAWIGSFCFMKINFFSLLALGLPLLLLLNLVLLTFWLFFTKSKGNILISLIPITFCLLILNRFSKIRESEQTQGEINIMSYNIKEFTPYENIYQEEDLYLFDKKYNALIEEEDPDILCLQEFSERGNELKELYPYHVLSSRLEDKAVRPLLTLSKYPIIDHYTIKIKGNYTNNLCTDIVIKQDTVRVINLHMESLTLRKKSIKKDLQDSTLFVTDRYLSVYNRLTKGFDLHYDQINTISQEIKKSPYPVILCGDFNNTPFSYEYSKVISNLNDTYIYKGNGIVDTYHLIPIPIRIDYVFTSPSIEINSYEVIEKKISDHYPVKVSFTLP